MKNSIFIRKFNQIVDDDDDVESKKNKKVKLLKLIDGSLMKIRNTDAVV
jgi:hypothetical protein